MAVNRREALRDVEADRHGSKESTANLKSA